MFEVWITDLSIPLTEEEYKSLLSRISIEKRRRIEKYYFYEDAERSLIGDILIRTLILKYGLYRRNSKDTIIFKMNEFGKPYFPDNPDVHFNISHAGKRVACAICDNSIGIDIEDIKPIDLSIAKRFFTDNEFEYIRVGENIDLKYRRFYSIWTQKEAYTKRQGMGLYIPLKSFDVLTYQYSSYFQCVLENSEYICNTYCKSKESAKIFYITVQELIALFNVYYF